jgi:hypothetical protein
MNNIIKELAEQAMIFSHENGGWRISTHVPNDFKEKFAELLMQECMTICNETQAEYTTAQLSVYEFSEKNIHANGASACERVRNKIKRRFGVQ